MVQALLAAARAVPMLLRTVGTTAGKAAPSLEKGAASLPRGANEMASKGGSKPGGSGPMDFLNTAMNMAGMGEMVKDLIPKKLEQAQPGAGDAGPGQGPKGGA